MSGMLRISCLMMVLSMGEAAAQQKLYAGEESVTLAGLPAIIYFSKGDPDKPTFIFAPGGGHLARISYGGHEGSSPKDFLAHAMNEAGYSFLAVSYPIDSKVKSYTEAVPGYTAQDWAAQIAAAASAKISENSLSKDVIISGWSMGGKVIQPASSKLTDAGLNVRMAVSFAATPGIPGLIEYTRNRKMEPSGYTPTTGANLWLPQLAENSKVNSRTIIPEQIYRDEYIGGMPVGLLGYGEVYEDGHYKLDHLKQATDYGAFQFAGYPFVAVLVNDRQVDGRHGLTDCANWNLYNSTTLAIRYDAAVKASKKELPPEKWSALLALQNDLQKDTCVKVGGNHFIFVGEEQAKRSVEAITRSLENVDRISRTLTGILEQAD